MSRFANVPCWIIVAPGHLKTQEMCNEIMSINPLSLVYAPDRFKTKEMCIKAIEVGPWELYIVPDHLKTQEMCDKAGKDDFLSLQYVPDWFVTHGQVKIWHDDSEYHDDDDDEVIEWYDGYKKRKAQKAKIKEELLPIAWHPDRVMDWCMSDDEKRWWK